MIADEEGAKAWLKSLPDCEDQAWDKLEQLVAMLREENARQNLVSAGSLADIWRRHVADSAQLICHVSRETTGPWLDLGTGAGFPGLVLACLQPGREVRLAESRPLRCDWLRRAADQLSLSHVHVLECQIEKLDPEHAEIISARAFAPLPRLLKLSARFSTGDTVWLLPKGRSAKQELSELQGWQHSFHVEQSLTDSEAGIIVGKLTGRKGKTRD